MTTHVKTKKGFSLVELLIAIGIFAIIIVAVTDIFGKSFRGYRRNIIIQRNMETAQQTMNLIAKTLRTGTWVAGASGGNFIEVYDYSRTSNNCIRFTFVGEVIQLRQRPGDATTDPPTCSGGGTTVALNDINQVRIDNADLRVTRSMGNTVGKITVSFRVCPSTGCAANNDQVRIQTTVSLRDYDKTSIGN